MVDAYLRQSPLASYHIEGEPSSPASAGYELHEHTYQGLVNIRGDINDSKFKAAIKKALRIDLPAQANTSTGNPNGTHVLWLGPNEWLIVTKPGDIDKTLTSLRKSCEGLHISITDVSEARTVICLSGDRALDILEKGCSLDLHPNIFTEKCCAQTQLARANIIVHNTGVKKPKNASTYEIYILRSFAGYLWQWILDAGNEFE